MINEEEVLVYFVVGDIGDPGSRRNAVAHAMSQLQNKLFSESRQSVSFVISTGDNLYSKREPEEHDFTSIVESMLDKVPTHWFFCLGNHDVKKGKYEWHRRHNGRSGDNGWHWHCPAPAYSIEDCVPGICKGLIDIQIINTNKLQSGWPRGGKPPGPSSFYTSNDRSWWKEQKVTLERLLANSDIHRRWNTVIGHHPAEYVPISFKEHYVPVFKYFHTTFMRGGRDSRSKRMALNHILRRGCDLYICGHQHLMADMKLKPSSSGSRPLSETRCRFIVMGCSSKLEQDEDDFEECISYSNTVEENPTARRFTATATTKADESSPGPVKLDYKSIPNSVHRGDQQLTETKIQAEYSRRYDSEWVKQGNLGFCCVQVSKSALKVNFYSVDFSSWMEGGCDTVDFCCVHTFEITKGELC